MKGFTLVEVVVALFVFALLSACLIVLLSNTVLNFHTANTLGDQLATQKQAMLLNPVYENKEETTLFLSVGELNSQIPVMIKNQKEDGFYSFHYMENEPKVRVFAPKQVQEIICTTREGNVLEVQIIPSQGYTPIEGDVVLISFPKECEIKNMTYHTSLGKVEQVEADMLVLRLKEGILTFIIQIDLSEKEDFQKLFGDPVD